jgi:hypothetical protein
MKQSQGFRKNRKRKAHASALRPLFGRMAPYSVESHGSVSSSSTLDGACPPSRCCCREQEGVVCRESAVRAPKPATSAWIFTSMWAMLTGPSSSQCISVEDPRSVRRHAQSGLEVRAWRISAGARCCFRNPAVVDAPRGADLFPASVLLSPPVRGTL